MRELEFRTAPPRDVTASPGANSAAGSDSATMPDAPDAILARAPVFIDRVALSRFDRTARKVIEAGPLPAGSVNGWAVLVLELGTVALAALYFAMARPPRVNARLEPRLRWPGRCFAAFFVLFIPLQLVPLPKGVVRVLSPRAVAVREASVPRFADLRTMSLSLAPSRTFQDALALLACVLAGFLVVRVIVHRKQIVRMMSVIAASGVFQSFFGLFQLPRSHPSLLFYPKTHNLDSVTGTFVNRNHFSGYLELVIPLVLALLISRVDLLAMPGMKWRRRLEALTSRGMTANVVLTIGLVVMALGILKSRSRSGAVLLALTFLVFVELIVLTFGRIRVHRKWLLRCLAACLILIAVVALYSGIESMIGRFSVDNLLQDGRPRYWSSVMRVIKDFPLFGTGLGTFALTYEAYDTFGMEGMFDHAHNDYLEYLSELGVIGFGILFAAILFVFIDAFRTWYRRRDNDSKALAMGGLVATGIILLHSLTDFNLHIPATMFLFAVVVGLTWTTVYHRKS
jgi:O-antigen ligase